MIDLKLIRREPDRFRRGGELKHIPCSDTVDRIVALDGELRAVLPRLEGGRAEQKKAGKAMGRAAPEEREALLARQKELKREIKSLEERQKEIRAELDELLLLVPNPPDEEAPRGKSEEENRQVRTWGRVPEFPFEARDHLALCEAHGLADFIRAGRIAGSRSYLLRDREVRVGEAVQG